MGCPLLPFLFLWVIMQQCSLHIERTLKWYRKRNWKVLALGCANYLEIGEANFRSSVSKEMLCSMPLIWVQHKAPDGWSWCLLYTVLILMWDSFIVVLSYLEKLCQTNLPSSEYYLWNCPEAGMSKFLCQEPHGECSRLLVPKCKFGTITEPVIQ